MRSWPVVMNLTELVKIKMHVKKVCYVGGQVLVALEDGRRINIGSADENIASDFAAVLSAPLSF